MLRKLRMLAFVLVGGGLLLQTTTGCDQILAPVLAQVLTAVLSSVVSGALAT
ncbi:MAG: hypothetical protein FWC56_03080 [Phycisphaerae bacterium]|nr:hypothetical protein [Phycisphaerae bacterium]